MTKDQLRDEIRSAACACEELAIGHEPIEGASLDEIIEHATRLLANAKRYRGDVEPGEHHCETCQCPEIEAVGLRVPEPRAVHELYNGETAWNFHQQCGCDRCRQVYADICRAQDQNDLQSLNRGEGT
jgi:hypothetical protein